MRNVYVCVNYVIEVFTIYDNGDGGNTADMEFVYEGTQRERFRNLADDKGFMCDR